MYLYRRIYDIGRQFIGLLLWFIGLAGLPDNTTTWGKWMNGILPFIHDPIFVAPVLFFGSLLLAWTWADMRYRRLIETRASLASGLAEPNTPLRTMFIYLERMSAFGKMCAATIEEGRLSVLKREFLTKARTGQLQVWGEEYPDGPFAPIAQDFWQYNDIDSLMLALPSTSDAVDSDNKHAEGAHKLFNIHVSRAEMISIWPSCPWYMRRVSRPIAIRKMEEFDEVITHHQA